MHALGFRSTGIQEQGWMGELLRAGSDPPSAGDPTSTGGRRILHSMPLSKWRIDRPWKPVQETLLVLECRSFASLDPASSNPRLVPRRAPLAVAQPVRPRQQPAEHLAALRTVKVSPFVSGSSPGCMQLTRPQPDLRWHGEHHPAAASRRARAPPRTPPTRQPAGVRARVRVTVTTVKRRHRAQT